MTDTYHTEIDPISKTQLNMFYEDPETFYRMFVKREIERPAVGQAAEIGRIVHAWLLDRRPLDSLILPIPADCLKSNGAINRQRLDEFRKDIDADIFLLKPDRFLEVVECLQSAMSVVNQIGANEENSEFESEVHAQYMGVNIKCRLDILVYAYSINDIKCSENIDDRSFYRSARNHRYWLQDAHYCGTLAANRGIDDPTTIPFTFWTIETKPPYRVHWRQYDDHSRAQAFEEWCEILGKYRLALESGRFETRRSHYLEMAEWERLYGDELVEWEGVA